MVNLFEYLSLNSAIFAISAIDLANLIKIGALNSDLADLAVSADFAPMAEPWFCDGQWRRCAGIVEGSGGCRQSLTGDFRRY